MSGSASARFGPLILVLLLTFAAAVAVRMAPRSWLAWTALAGAGALALRGVWDLFQPRHTLLRNYPLLAHFRWFFEFLRPFLRQYIVENDREGRPYNRDQRSLIYERAKDQVDVKPFGSDLDAYDAEFQVLAHSMAPCPKPDADFRVRVGGEQCAQAGSGRGGPVAARPGFDVAHSERRR